jgi:hypothetical protein
VSLDENIDARRKAAVLELVKTYRSSVLLASENKLQLFLALRLKAPGWEGGRHQDQHHGQRDQQGGHRVATFSVLTP